MDSEQEMLREKQGDRTLFERRPFESSRQATYEDSTSTRRDRDFEAEHPDS